jgi:hypothetical protein
MTTAVMAAPRLAHEVRVGDIMTTDPRTIDRNQTLDVADGLISGLPIRHLPWSRAPAWSES